MNCKQSDPIFKFEELETKIGQMIIDLKNLIGDLELMPPTEFKTAEMGFDKFLKKYGLQQSSCQN